MNSFNRTFLPTLNYQHRNWFIIDCRGQKLGRLATTVTKLLRGKMKPHYHPSIDVGDYVILIHADSISMNPEAKHYLVSKPGKPGSSLKIKDVIHSSPQFTIERAVKGMLSSTEKKRLMRRLNVYPDHNHPHQAQTPIPMDPSQMTLPVIESR
jgi:large subunit ribosomal protein L13